jgi:DNA-binding NarL/FixJ family response regulator
MMAATVESDEVIRVLLVDDEAAVRQGLRMRMALEPDLDVVGEAANGIAAVKAAHTLDPDVVVIDVEMPRMDGITAIGWLREAAPSASVVVLSVYDDEEARARARAAGAEAFVGKQEGVDHLLDVIRAVGRS